MSGPDMLLQAALKAFVPKQTAEAVSAAIEGMLRDGTLNGIGSLVADIQEIKRSQARIEFGLGRIYAGISMQQQFHSGGTKNRLSGNAGTGPDDIMAPIYGPQHVAGSRNNDDAGGEFDGVRGGDIGETGSIGTKDAAE